LAKKKAATATHLLDDNNKELPAEYYCRLGVCKTYKKHSPERHSLADSFFIHPEPAQQQDNDNTGFQRAAGDLFGGLFRFGRGVMSSQQTNSSSTRRK
jgi:hypothetical protein